MPALLTDACQTEGTRICGMHEYVPPPCQHTATHNQGFIPKQKTMKLSLKKKKKGKIPVQAEICVSPRSVTQRMQSVNGINAEPYVPTLGIF